MAELGESSFTGDLALVPTFPHLGASQAHFLEEDLSKFLVKSPCTHGRAEVQGKEVTCLM